MLTNKQIDNRMKKLVDLEAEKKRIQDEIDRIKNEVQEEMADVEVLETANFNIRYTFVTSARFDSKAFKAAHPMMYDKYTKETKTRRFSYKTA